VLGERQGRRVQFRPQARRQARCGRFLEQLLVAPLYRAVALAELDGVTTVAEDLHLDMPATGDEPFEVHPRVAEGGQRLGARVPQRRGQRRWVGDHPQAPPATALTSTAGRAPPQAVRRPPDREPAAGQHGPGSPRVRPGGELVSGPPPAVPRLAR
jgi:hypothetical protein